MTNRKQVVKVIWYKAASPLHMDCSVVFARWRECAPPPTNASSGPPESTSQMASRVVQPYVHSSQLRVPILYSGHPFSTSKLPLRVGDLYRFPTAHLRPQPKRHLNRFCFCRAHLTTVTDRQTVRSRYSFCNNRPLLHCVSKKFPPLNSL